MQHEARSPSASPPTTGPAPVVANNAALQAQVASWMEQAQAALGSDGSEASPAQALPEPRVDGGVIDDSLRVLRPEALDVMSLGELVEYLDAALAAFVDAMAAELGGSGPPAEAPGPEATEGPPEECAPALSEEEIYRSQLDNETAVYTEARGPENLPEEKVRKAAVGQCSPTSLTMSLVRLAGGEAPLREQVVSVASALKLRTSDPATTDLEELIIEMLLKIDWKEAFAAQPALFDNDPAWQGKHTYVDVIKNPYAQTFLAAQFACCSNTALEMASAGWEEDFDARWEQVLQAHQEGAAISFQGGFTGNGHVVHVVSMDPGGMVVHDPYGACLAHDWYLKNGKAPAGQRRATLEQRWGGDRERLEAFDQGEAREDWGRENIYSREELQALDALTWALILRGSA